MFTLSDFDVIVLRKKLIKSWNKCDDLCKLLYSSFTAQDYISGGNVNNNEKDYTISP